MVFILKRYESSFGIIKVTNVDAKCHYYNIMAEFIVLAYITGGIASMYYKYKMLGSGKYPMYLLPVGTYGRETVFVPTSPGKFNDMVWTTPDKKTIKCQTYMTTMQFLNEDIIKPVIHNGGTVIKKYKLKRPLWVLNHAPPNRVLTYSTFTSYARSKNTAILRATIAHRPPLMFTAAMLLTGMVASNIKSLLDQEREESINTAYWAKEGKPWAIEKQASRDKLFISKIISFLDRNNR